MWLSSLHSLCCSHASNGKKVSLRLRVLRKALCGGGGVRGVRRVRGGYGQRAWPGRPIEIRNIISVPISILGNKHLCVASNLIFLHLSIWRVCEQPCSSVHFFKICASMLSQVFLRMLPRLHQLPSPTKFNILLQPKLEFEAILHNSPPSACHCPS